MGSDLSPGLSAGVVAPLPAEPAPARPGERFAAFVERTLSARRRRDYRRVFWSLAVVVLAFFALVVAHGPCLQVTYGHDDIGFLAAAWKVRCGIWPHADYHSALGALNPWIHAAGMWLLGPTATVIPFCNALVAVGLGSLAWTVASRRLPALPAGIFAFTQTVVAMTPHLLRFEWFDATYDGYYNRQCYALVSTLLLLAFPASARSGGPAGLSPRRTFRRRDSRGPVFPEGQLFHGRGRFVRDGLRPGETLCEAGALAWSGGGRGHFPVVSAADPFRSRRHVGRPAHGRGARGRGVPAAEFSVGRYLACLPDAWLEVALLATAQAILRPPLFFRRRARAGGLVSVPTWAEFVAVVGASMFLCMTNAPGGSHSETPLLTSWIFVIVGSLLRASAAGERQPERISLPFVGAVACVLWCYTFGNGFRCLCWVASPWPTPWQQTALADNPRFESNSLASLPILDAGGEPSPLPYAGKVNDGLRLLRALGGTHRVEALDFVDPFPFALQWPATRGGMWCWHNGYSFGLLAHPSPEEAFGDADVLMVPRFAGESSSFRVMEQLYAPYVKAHFRPTAKSGQWLLLQKR